MTSIADSTRSALRVAVSARPLGERGTRLLSFARPISFVAVPARVPGDDGVTFNPFCAGFNPLSSRKARVLGQEAWPQYQTKRDARHANVQSGKAGP